jgi:hypothetical protein
MKTIILLSICLPLAACSQGNRMVERSPAATSEAAAVSTTSSPERRYLALKHKLTLSIPEASLPQQFKLIQAECIKAGCEILSAGQTSDSPTTSVGATLSARVPPAAFAAFFQNVQTQGKLVSHHSESEDKTAEVIDVEARLKNLEALKARVLELLAKNTGNLKDMLDAEKQLAETQAALDSINGQRRALASLTDMVRVDIELVSTSSRSEGSWAAPVLNAVDEAGETFMQSIGMLITFVVGLLPWAVLAALLSTPLRRAWRRRREAKAAGAPLEK